MMMSMPDTGGSTAPDVSIQCSGMHDSDADGLTNAEECTLGTDPYRPDSDGDNVPDGVEVNYPRVCVATDRMRQRRPVVNCMMDAQCMTGERCMGISPTRSDSDGDSVPDGEEDLDRDGMIVAERGETDPRLPDTDGDGRPDSMGGVEICRPRGLASVTQLGLPMAQVQVGHDPLVGQRPARAGVAEPLGRGDGRRGHQRRGRGVQPPRDVHRPARRVGPHRARHHHRPRERLGGARGTLVPHPRDARGHHLDVPRGPRHQRQRPARPRRPRAARHDAHRGRRRGHVGGVPRRHRHGLSGQRRGRGHRRRRGHRGAPRALRRHHERRRRFAPSTS